MHRWCGALTLALLIGAAGGCADSSQAQRVAALQEYHDLLEDQWQVDIATERDEVHRQIGEMHREVVSLAEKIGETEQWMTERAQPALEDLKMAADETARKLGGILLNDTVLSVVDALLKKTGGNLLRRIDEIASRLKENCGETADRLDAVELECAESGRALSALKEEIAARVLQLRSERRKAIDNLRGEIPDTKAIEAPVEKLLDDWRQSGRLAGIETRERYLWLIIFVNVALALVNMVIALWLWPRHSKQAAEALRKAAEALRKAEAAEKTAIEARSALLAGGYPDGLFDALWEKLQKADNSPAGSETPSDA